MRLYGPGLECLRREIGTAEPTVTFLDSFRRISRVDENSSKEVAAEMEKLIRIQEDFGTAIVFLHHSTQEIPNGPNWEDVARGSGDFFAAVDAMWGLRKTGKLTGRLRASTRAGDLEPFDLEFDPETLTFRRAPAPEPEAESATERCPRSKGASPEKRLLEIVRKHPGQSGRMLRKAMQISPKRLGDLLHRLAEEKIQNREGGWYPMSVTEDGDQP